MMKAKQTPIQEQPARDGRRLSSFMTIAAWVTLSIGLLTCLFQLSDFSDRNLGLMIGLGFMIGSVQIYTIGAAMRLFHHNKPKQFG